MGDGTEEMNTRHEHSQTSSGAGESSTTERIGSAAHISDANDAVSDAAYGEGLAGAAFHDSMTGMPASEDTVSAPYAENLTGDPYGERTGTYIHSPVASSDADDAPDADDPDIETNRDQIEHTRAELSETIDAIQQKLSPSNLADQARETVREATIGKAQDMASNVSDTAMSAVSNVGDTAKGAGNTLIETIKQNPVPAALTAIGVGWLFTSMRKNSSAQVNYRYNENVPYTYSDDYTSGRSRGIGQTSGGSIDQMQSRAGDLAGQAQDTAGQISNQVQGAAGETVSQAQDAARRATTMMRDNSLGVGVAAFALGLVAGLAIPETEKEDQLMGERRDSLAQRAQQTVQETAQKVQTVAQEAVTAGKQKAQDQNLM